MFLTACIGLNSSTSASLDVSCHAKHNSLHVFHGDVCTLVLTETRHVRESVRHLDRSTAQARSLVCGNTLVCWFVSDTQCQAQDQLQHGNSAVSSLATCLVGCNMSAQLGVNASIKVVTCQLSSESMLPSRL